MNERRCVTEKLYLGYAGGEEMQQGLRFAVIVSSKRLSSLRYKCAVWKYLVRGGVKESLISSMRSQENTQIFFRWSPETFCFMSVP